jgi:hypothetical protein
MAAFTGAAACQSATPPAGPTPPSGTPIVRNMEPTVPLPNPAPQTIRLIGLDFRSGLTVTLTLPGGALVEVPSSGIVIQSPTMVDLTVTLIDAGPYRVVVRNANGFRSDPFDFSVVNEVDRKPIVESLLPASVARSTLPRVISVTGRNFLIGVTIRMTDPLGVIRTLDDASIVRRGDTALDVSAVFDRQGAYVLVVVNPSGDLSDSVTLTVN